jgi:hypothetical protein
MKLSELIKHSAIATAAVGLASKPIEQCVEKTNMSPENKITAKTVAEAGVLGIFLEGVITEALRNGGEKYSLKQRAGSMALTTSSLMLSSYLISRYIKPRVNNDAHSQPGDTIKEQGYAKE